MSGRALRTVLVLGVSCATLSLLPACTKSEPVEGAYDAADKLIVPNRREQAALASATEAARASLPIFWAMFDAKPAEITDYTLKVALPVGDGRTELIWAEPLNRTDTEILVRILNEPQWIKTVKYGSEIRVTPDAVTDWTYTKNGKAYGHFTTRALLSKATPEQRAEAEALFAPTPLEPENP